MSSRRYSATKSRPALHSWQVYPGALLLTPQMLISWQMWVAPSMTKWLMMAKIIALSCGAELLHQVLGDIRGVRLHIPSKVVHLIDAFGTGELWPCALGEGDGENKEESENLHLGIAEQNSH